ncbi:type II toxin-antitoxin system RelE family toxin [Corticicoccus populi]|uniref:Type II toxin-antitoxin system RelE/ParE family toxin n=1 Tax=Corticicoccus populi TaxID=1812821 RepID=A0ABW5WXC1_9STAP
MYELQFTQYSQAELDKLDGSKKIFVYKAFQRIKIRGMEAGQPLSGELNQCRKLKNNKLGLRIVFREVNDKIEVIEIVAIGNRSDKEVYKNSIKRLRDV